MGGGAYQGWLDSLVNIDKILPWHAVAILLGRSCDIKLNRVIIMTADPSKGNVIQHWSKNRVVFSTQISPPVSGGEIP